MSNDARDTFDPRFDPAFQPGFEGAVVAAPVSRRPRDESPARTVLEQRAELIEKAGTTAQPTPADQQDEDGDTRRKPNPFLLALLVLSFGLIAGGLGAAQSVLAVFDTENIAVDIDYMFLEMVKFAAPLAVALGVAIGAGVLFVYALDWKKRNES